VGANTKSSNLKGVKKVNKHLKDVKVEMKKVHWPTRQQLLVFTLIVLFSVFTIGVFFWLLDIGFTALLQLIIT